MLSNAFRSSSFSMRVICGRGHLLPHFIVTWHEQAREVGRVKYLCSKIVKIERSLLSPKCAVGCSILRHWPFMSRKLVIRRTDAVHRFAIEREAPSDTSSGDDPASDAPLVGISSLVDKRRCPLPVPSPPLRTPRRAHRKRREMRTHRNDDSRPGLKMKKSLASWRCPRRRLHFVSLGQR